MYKWHINNTYFIVECFSSKLLASIIVTLPAQNHFWQFSTNTNQDRNKNRTYLLQFVVFLHNRKISLSQGTLAIQEDWIATRGLLLSIIIVGVFVKYANLYNWCSSFHQNSILQMSTSHPLTLSPSSQA